jgi:hypothetical protein
MVDARPYNGNIWFADKNKVEGEYLISLVGIADPQNVMVVEGDSDPRSLRQDAVYDASKGITIRNKDKCKKTAT